MSTRYVPAPWSTEADTYTAEPFYAASRSPKAIAAAAAWAASRSTPAPVFVQYEGPSPKAIEAAKAWERRHALARRQAKSDAIRARQLRRADS